LFAAALLRSTPGGNSGTLRALYIPLGGRVAVVRAANHGFGWSRCSAARVWSRLPLSGRIAKRRFGRHSDAE